ncbi:MAG: sigma-54 dependent transcriptional regulator [Deltaproteobacteria bacterium]|nr:sigma-54 dependent transcriptional regulator [Deltaproteobacteria bacterium]
MTRPIALLINDEPDQSALESTLEQAGYEVRSASSASEALRQLDGVRVVITNLMAEPDGLAVCRKLGASAPHVPVVLLTARASLATVVAALRAGAHDLLLKPVPAEHLIEAAARAVVEALRRAPAPVDRPSAAPRAWNVARPSSSAPGPSGLLGSSRSMQAVRETIERLADTSASVLLLGETGTGKELAARSIHAQSARATGPFVAINCAALVPTVLESELFGHVSGAFTDATSRVGLFVKANHGTLFLDEVGELPPPLQVKVLRALQTRVVRPVGANFEVAFDARLVSATHKNLEAAMNAGAFRPDLYYRIDVATLSLPPLHERGLDVLLLAERFLRLAAARNPGAPESINLDEAERLLAYRWPGNVRELESCMERVAMLGGSVIDGLPAMTTAPEEPPTTPTFAFDAGDADNVLTLDELGRRYVRRTLDLVDGDWSRAAALLGVSRRTVKRLAGAADVDRFTLPS